MPGDDDLGMPPEVVFDLTTEFLETDVLPTLRDGIGYRSPTTSHPGCGRGGRGYS